MILITAAVATIIMIRTAATKNIKIIIALLW